MVFRKPYAFLIKNFIKIHILLLLLWGFIYYKIYGLRSFIKEFILFGTYNKNLEGINTKIGFLLYLSIILVIIISILLLLLLRYKKKPWKLYLIIIAEYILMFYACIKTAAFFNTYSIATEAVSDVYIYRDIINITNIIQYIVLIILLLRITGLDLKKFEFKNDKEFLELNSKDREEFEISIEIDKHSFKRKYNQLKRNISYFYKEHKFICNIFFTILFISLIGYNYYYFGVKTKSYKQGQNFQIGIYNIKVDNVYVTNVDFIGNQIELGNKFVIAKITMKNNSNEDIEPDFSRFHLMNGTINKTNIVYYDEEFKDIGKGVSTDYRISKGKEKQFTLIYKVPEKLENKKFVLYYQEYNGYNNTYLRKIKLNVKDISKVASTKKYNFKESIKFKTLDNKTREVTFEEYKLSDTENYNRHVCSNDYNCRIDTKQLTVQNGYKILKIEFSSSDFEGKDFIDFTSKCATINYVDSNSKKHTVKVINLISTDYQGKEMFIKVSNDIVDAKEIYLNYIIRDKEYVVRIK